MERQKTIILPLTEIGRKYGYIMWKKKHDLGIKEIFGNNKYVDLSIGEILQKQKRIDWDHRRIGITYTLTRGLRNSVSKIQIRYLKENCFSVHFE